MLKFKKPKRKITKVFLHCTAYPHGDLIGLDLVKAVSQWHRNRGWKDIGYHFIIDLAGNIYEGRSIEAIPAAQRGYNSHSIAICVDGLNKFTDISLRTVKEFCYSIDNVYDNGVTFHGHCEVNKYKTCPVFNYKSLLNLDSRGYIESTNHKLPDIPMLTMTSTGSTVITLQKRLDIVDKYNNLLIDGIFGRDTYNAVVNFQKSVDLEPDGIVGPLTWNELFCNTTLLQSLKRVGG